MRVIDLRVEGEERTAVETEQGEAEEEKDTFKVALATVAEDDDHPEEHQESARGKTDQADVEKGGHY